MDRQILLIHSDPAVIEDTLNALEPFLDRIMVSTEPALAAHLCRTNTPDLMLLEFTPERFGGSEGLHEIGRQTPGLISIMLTTQETKDIPGDYIRAGVRHIHSIPIDTVRLRAQIERCLWMTQPQYKLKTLQQDVAERTKSLDTFLDISRAITANLRNDLDTLLRRIAEETSKILNAERTSLFIYDKEHGCLWSRVAEGEGGRTITLGMDEPGIIVHVARIGQPIRVDDVYREPLFNREVDRITGYHTRTILCFPVRNYHGELIGVMETMNKKSGMFDYADERLLSIMSFLFASAIENAQLYEAVRHQIRENESLEALKIQANRLATVGQMASSIIHDIRSPLAIIRGYAELAVTRAVSTEKRLRFANTITSEVRRLRDMAEELQEFSEGTHAVELNAISLHEVIEEVVDFLDSDFRDRGIHIIHHAQYTGQLMLDAPRIKRILHNLTGNAADAMPDGGTLMITAARVAEYVHLEIHDTGSGIPDEIRERIFDPFVTHGKTHGTGLGLAVVTRIVEEHHGDVSVSSSTTGTTFTIRLPLTIDQHSSKQPEAKVASL
ncbi:MAG: ATP-binding protein [Gemmatimonadota bacterium]|nr:ATP-binding protein [Gemmatimonadota bacterium]